ncbi:MAG: sulfatase-like hydrolase/transferase [Myxococcota bacterium]
MLSRRELLTSGALAGAGSLVRGAGGGPRPDIVLVLADDLAARVLGPYGGEAVPTRAIDRLAAEGVTFDRCYVTLSLCSPSRASILTGRWPHDHGVADNGGARLADEGDTVAGWLRAAGYRTAYVGKWHMGDRDDPRPGFDRWVSFRGQGSYDDPTLNVDGKVAVHRGYLTDLLTDHAVRFLTEPGDAPRFLILAHKGTHAPFTPAPRHRDLPVRWPIPAVPAGDLRGKPDWVKARVKRVTPASIEETARGYLNTLRSVDDSVARVTEALGDRLDRAMVVLTSDNGYFLGEHGLLAKRAIYEESAKLPLIVRWPALAKPGARVEQLAANVDLAPTFAEAGGAAVPPSVQGRSLVPLLAGEPEGWRDALLYEYFLDRDVRDTPDTLGVITRRRVYAASAGTEELYDLVADPGQHHNVAKARPAETREMRARLEQLKAETRFRVPPPSPDPPPPVRTNAFVLRYTLGQPGDTVRDHGPHGLDGLATGAPLVTVDGRVARRFDGEGDVAAPDAEELDPSRGPWTVEAWVRAEAPDGVVLAHSTERHGLLLGLRDGRPIFVARSKRTTTVSGAAPIVGRWTHLAGVIAKEKRLLLYVDGALAAEAPLRAFLRRQPGRGLSIGRDRGEPLTRLPGLVGAVASVAIYSGERAPADIGADAKDR